jgi:processive 1,2-diacylglycerol beta-glucosyltransferase
LAEKEHPFSGVAREEFNKILNRHVAPKLIRFFDIYRPALVICTHPFPVGILYKLTAQGYYTKPVAAIITDFTVHPFWVFPKIDLYFVASEDTRLSFREYGISLKQVHPCGIPIDLRFANPLDLSAVKAGLSLNPKLPTVLVMGGGLGLGPMADIVKSLGDSPITCQMIVVTGQNVALRTKLERMAPGLINPVKVLGFVNNIHELMSVSDLIIGKAGGLTCAESLAKGLPIFIVDPIPGQEIRNTEFLKSKGAAVSINSVKELAQTVGGFLSEPRRLKKMSTAAAYLGKPQAARNIIRMIERFIASGGLESASN